MKTGEDLDSLETLILNDYDSLFDHLAYPPPRVLSPPSTNEFVVFWEHELSGRKTILGRKFFPDGSPQGSSFFISEVPDLSDVYKYSTAMDSEGNFVVVWSDTSDSKWDVRWRWFQSDGSPSGPNESIITNPYAELCSPDLHVAIAEDGKGVVVWEQREYGVQRIFAQRFLVEGVEGVPLGGSFRVSVAEDELNQHSPKVAVYNNKIYSVWKKENIKIWASIIDFNDPPAYEPIQHPPLFHHNYPNPFNTVTTIKYAVSQRSHVRIEIYNILGIKIRFLLDEEALSGVHEVNWNGKDEEGNDLPSGIYFTQFKVGENVQTRKMILVR